MAKRSTTRKASRGSTGRSSAPPPRGRSSARGRGNANQVPLIVGAVVSTVAVLAALIMLFSGGGGGGAKGVKRAAESYLAAWSGGDVDAIIELEFMDEKRANALIADIRPLVDRLTSRTRKPKDVRGKVTARDSALYEMGDLDFESTDRVKLARGILAASYKAYFAHFANQSLPELTYEVKRVDVDGEEATVLVTLSPKPPKDMPEVLPLNDLHPRGALVMTRRHERWLVVRAGGRKK